MLVLRASTRCYIRCNHLSRRYFFASSTDHTTLLKNAEVYCIPQADGKKQYALVADGMDLETVTKVPQLHLARIWLDGNTIYGAKVVNRTLGTEVKVCGRLFDAALNDAGKDPQALSTLHGLSEWVVKGIQGKESIEILSNLEEREFKAVEAIAGGKFDNDSFDIGKDAWKMLAGSFVSEGLGAEAALYQSKGGNLIRIDNNADTSDFRDTSGGAMAVFSFP